MLAIEGTILPNGEINYSLSEPYDIGVRFDPDPEMSKRATVKLNLDSLVECYDVEQCYEEYNADYEARRAEEAEAAEAVKRGEVVERHPHYGEDYYIRRAPHEIVHGLFLHFSDDGYLRRESVISLTIDGKKYNLSKFFAPSTDDEDLTSDVYIKIPLELLRELAAAASISLTFEYEQEGFKDKEIDDFQKYALAYYNGYYIEHLGTPEEKEKLRQEMQAQKQREAKEKAQRRREEAKKKAQREREEAEKKARWEREDAEEAAALKAEWDAAGPLSKLRIKLKRHWKLILLILFILWILFNL